MSIDRSRRRFLKVTGTLSAMALGMGAGLSLSRGGEGKPSRCFDFEKQGMLIPRPEGMRKPGPYYTCLVEMGELDAFPGDYALYFSTDHGGRGGIWLYICSGNPLHPDNWRSYDRALQGGEFQHLQDRPSGNPIFVGNPQGGHTETPHVQIVNGTVHMTYHSGAGHGQSTLLATSSNGVTFNYSGDDSIILDYDPQESLGSGHTGYFRWAPNRFAGVPYDYVGYSLHGGGKNYHSAIWGSDDALEWDKLAVMSPDVGPALPAENRLLIWHGIDPGSITRINDNEYAAICAVGNRAWGSMPRVVELYEIFLADDGRTLTRPARKIMGTGPEGSLDTEEVAEPTTLRSGDRRKMLYVGVSDRGKTNTVMAASGRFNRDATLPERLTSGSPEYLQEV